MSGIAVMGPAEVVGGYALAGAAVVDATPATAAAAWAALDPGIAVVIVTEAVARALGDRPPGDRRLVVAIPE